MSKKHSIFSASSAERWVNCPGSVALSRGYANTSSAAALDGTIGHEVADICIRTGANPYEVTEVDIDGTMHAVSEDTQANIVDYMAFLNARKGTDGQLLSEVRIDYSKVLGVPEEAGFGTSDIVILQADGSIEIIDLKLGRKFVEVSGNKQLMLYAAGVVDAMEEVSGTKVPSVTLGIYQPNISRAGSLETMTRAELMAQVKELKVAAKNVLAANASLKRFATPKGLADSFYADYTKAGEDQCRWCKHAAHCPTLKDATAEVVNECKSDDFDVVSAPTLIDYAPLRKAYESITLLEIFIKAVQDEVYARALKGEGEALGVKFVAGRAGNRKWADENVAGTQLISVLPEEIVYTKTLLSPATAEKALKKAKVTSLDMTELVTRSAPSKTLTAIADPRPVWTDGATTEDFN